jgi:hypothetical protein
MQGAPLAGKPAHFRRDARDPAGVGLRFWSHGSPGQMAILGGMHAWAHSWAIASS